MSTTPEPTPPIRSYTAFLSYRHADNKEEGRRWAEWLHQAIETYEVPADLIGKPNLRGESIPAGLYPVFRDEEELPADADLSDNIQRALQNSASLIVLCSPRACDSRFVADEIRTFKQLGKSPRILALMLDGEPNASDDPAKQKLGQAECLPQPLRFGVQGEDGSVDWSRRCEPIAADVRPEGRPEQGYTSAAAYRLALEKSGLPPREARRLATIFEERLNLARLKIIAGLLNVPLGQLRDRDAAFRLKKARRRQTLATGIAIAATLLTAFALWQRSEARTQRNAAQDAEVKARTNEQRALAGLKEASRSDFATAQQRIAEGKWQEAVAYLGRAIRYDEMNENAQQALWLALRYGRQDRGRMPVYPPLRHQNLVPSASLSPDGTCVVTASGDHTARLWELETGQPRVLLQHQDTVHSAFFSPDGTRIVTASEDKTARIWNAKTGQPIGDPLRHEGPVNCANFSPDGARVVTASQDTTLRIWDAKTGQPISTPLQHVGPVSNANFSPDSTRVVASSWETVGQWDAKTGLLIGHPLKHQDLVVDANFSPDGTRIVTASIDKTARLWDAQTGLPVGAPLQHQDKVNSASFSPDGTRIVTACSDNTARLWDAQTGLPVGAPLRHQEKVYCARFSPDGTRIVTACRDETARVWDARSGLPLGAPLQHQGWVQNARFSLDGTRIVTASWDKTVCVWDARADPPMGLPFSSPLYPGPVSGAAFSPDGTRVLTTSRWGKMARLWDAQTGLPMGASLQHQDTVESAGFSPDGTRVLTICKDFSAQVWDAGTGLPMGVPLQHQGAVESANFTPDGACVITVSGKIARLWDAKTGLPVVTHLPSNDAANSMSFSPDGTRVLTVTDQTVRLWVAKTGLSIGGPLEHEGAVDSTSFSPDGACLVTVCNNTARLWDTQTGLPMGEPLQHQGLLSVGFSSDGTRIVTSGNDNTVRLWNARTGLPMGGPLQHQNTVNSANFSSDSTRLVTASWDMTARLLDARTGLPMGVPLQHQDIVTSASFSPDGAWIVTVSNKMARLWDAKTGLPLGVPLQHQAAVTRANFSPDGARLITASWDGTTRVWDVKTNQRLSGPTAETLTAFCSGGSLDPGLGTLRQLAKEERTALWQRLEVALAGTPEWLFAAEHYLPKHSLEAPISPHFSVSQREAATRLLATGLDLNIREAMSLDPGHPLLPFSFSLVELKEDKELEQPPNLPRAAWLIAYGLQHLPADTSAREFRLAAQLVAKAAVNFPMAEQPTHRKTARELLDRAAQLTPEDDQSKDLRESLKK